MTTTQKPDPTTQVKGLTLLARAFVLAGLVVGVGLPGALYITKIRIVTTSSGFDLVWLPLIAIMIADFALAWHFLRRAERLESSLPPASPP